jgi:hypothetical protein
LLANPVKVQNIVEDNPQVFRTAGLLDNVLHEQSKKGGGHRVTYFRFQYNYQVPCSSKTPSRLGRGEKSSETYMISTVEDVDDGPIYVQFEWRYRPLGVPFIKRPYL